MFQLLENMQRRFQGSRFIGWRRRLVALLDELETRELIERRANPDDRRRHALHLTQKGRFALEMVGRLSREHSQFLLSALSPDEQRQLAALLRRVADAHGLTRGVHPGYRLIGRRSRRKTDSAARDKPTVGDRSTQPQSRRGQPIWAEFAPPRTLLNEKASRWNEDARPNGRNQKAGSSAGVSVEGFASTARPATRDWRSESRGLFTPWTSR
jgi:hypothetical protein